MKFKIDTPAGAYEFSTLAELGGILQCYAGRPSTITETGDGIMPKVTVPPNQVKYFENVAKFRASKWVKANLTAG